VEVPRSPLVAAFRNELDRRSGVLPLSPSAAEEARLESDLAAACARGHAAFPQLLLDDATFVAHLGRIVGVGEAGLDPIDALALEDLYLASACLAGLPGAVATFETKHGATIGGAIGRIVAPSDADEARQQLVQSLLVGSEVSPPKIGSYAGKAPLDRWLGVSAQRAALMWLRDNRAETRARDAAANEAAATPEAHPETAYIKEKYRGEFEVALAEALERLPDRDRVLLRLHLVNGVSVEKVGKMFSVTQPTVSRWMAAARERLLDDIKQALGPRLGTSSSELASLAGMVASRLDLSLSMLLKAR
jgi:RNA polymerase sigma-70 factor, ECF subfamily